MHLIQLKQLRVGVSVGFFLAATLLFLDFRNWFAPAASSFVLYPQFVPSVLRFLHEAALGAAGCFLVLLLTLYVGRVYCSFLCPLGTLQDFFYYFSRNRKRRTIRHRTPENVLRYTLLALTILVFFSGSNLILNLLDPFSSFGRIITNVVRPLGIVVNNVGAAMLEKAGVYTLVREHWAVVAPLSIGNAIAMLILLIWFASRHGRLYCNSICPVGTLLGLVSRFSFLKLRVDDNTCTNCRSCSSVCKADCIDLNTKTVDMSRCVGCFNCLTVCKTDAIDLAPRYTSEPDAGRQKTDSERREFLMHSGVYIMALAGISEPGSIGDRVKKIIQAKPTTIPVIRTSPISPPGSVGIDRFTTTCTSCHLCVSACPPQILLPSFMEYGVSGLMQPHMHFQTGHCNYECTICGDVCPAGAILPLTVEQKKLTQTGTAKFIKENCVVYTDNTACGACSEHCPTKAVNMVPYANKFGKPLTIPEVKPEICVGCGGCEHACPTKPYKAIFVDGNPKHKLAEKPVVQKVEQQVDYKEDFPF